MAGLVDELRRRNVVRVAGVYVVIGWLLAQIATTLEEALELPQWFDGMVLSLLFLGFPVALVLSWALEMTPDGLQRTDDLPDDAPPVPAAGRPLDIAILIALVVSIGVGVANLVVPDRIASMPAEMAMIDGDTEDRSTPSPTTSNIAESGDIAASSIAVLPFEALSANADDRFFGRGIAEELLNALAQFPDLKVAARTSAFSFEGQNVDLREVGEALGVSHVLEGSIRRSGERLRITAQLIRAEDGFHLWSDTFDRELRDVFAVQDEIVAELSRVLQFRLGVGAGTGRVASRDVSALAYEQYLRGLDFWQRRELSPRMRGDAIEAFRLATELDPNFADAWSSYAVSVSLSSPSVGPVDRREAVDRGFARAIELDPDNARAFAGLAFLYSSLRPDPDRAKQNLERALSLAPNSVLSHYAAASYYRAVGDSERANRAFERAITLDPLNYTISRVYHDHLAETGRYSEGLEYFQRMSECEADQCAARHVFAQVNAFRVASAFGSPVDSDREFKKLETMTMPPGTGLEQQAAAMRALVDFFTGRRTAEQITESELMLFRSDVESALYAALIMGDYDAVVNQLASNVERGVFIQSHYNHYAQGTFEWPDALRRHPRYHEFWQQPGMAELAERRRNNGVPYGLTLPME